MKYNPENIEKMAELHNELVRLVDATDLSPSEVCMVLDMISRNIKVLFEGSVKKERS